MQFLQTVIGVVAAMRDLAIVHFPGEGGSGLPADGRPFFAHADRPNFGLALWVVYGAVKATGSSSRQTWLEQALLDLSSTTN
jgi:hypothetical protein